MYILLGNEMHCDIHWGRNTLGTKCIGNGYPGNKMIWEQNALGTKCIMIGKCINLCIRNKMHYALVMKCIVHWERNTLDTKCIRHKMYYAWERRAL